MPVLNKEDDHLLFGYHAVHIQSAILIGTHRTSKPNRLIKTNGFFFLGGKSITVKTK